jgi:tRNA(Leu) C34 or U34 (ribose-2'-O)-methylase TrmL
MNGKCLKPYKEEFDYSYASGAYATNEASGLPEQCKSAGLAVRIPQSPFVDSLNLSVAAGIGMFIFAEKNELLCPGGR